MFFRSLEWTFIYNVTRRRYSSAASFRMVSSQKMTTASRFMSKTMQWSTDDLALESFMNFDGMQSWLQHFVFGLLLVQPTDCMLKPHSLTK